VKSTSQTLNPLELRLAKQHFNKNSTDLNKYDVKILTEQIELCDYELIITECNRKINNVKSIQKNVTQNLVSAAGETKMMMTAVLKETVASLAREHRVIHILTSHNQVIIPHIDNQKYNSLLNERWNVEDETIALFINNPEGRRKEVDIQLANVFEDLKMIKASIAAARPEEKKVMYLLLEVAEERRDELEHYLTAQVRGPVNAVLGGMVNISRALGSNTGDRIRRLEAELEETLSSSENSEKRVAGIIAELECLRNVN
jgi:hypothetical protein